MQKTNRYLKKLLFSLVPGSPIHRRRRTPRQPQGSRGCGEERVRREPRPHPERPSTTFPGRNRGIPAASRHHPVVSPGRRNGKRRIQRLRQATTANPDGPSPDVQIIGQILMVSHNMLATFFFVAKLMPI